MTEHEVVIRARTKLRGFPRQLLCDLALIAPATGVRTASIRWLAKQYDVHPSRVARALRTLEDAGELTTYRRRGRPMVYALAARTVRLAAWVDDDPATEGSA
jgi:DNA-binding transcriptional ArsR family regulator